jgi:hypothetical protein
MKKITKKLSEKELAKEKEKQEILARSNQPKTQSFALDETGDLVKVRDLKKFAFGGVENPEKKYEVYYKGLQRLLRKNLPEGKAYAKARSYIYEEKNTYLTRGHRKNPDGIRGADSRMGHLSEAETMLNIVIKWVRRNGTAPELYNTIREMNIKRGYGKPKF